MVGDTTELPLLYVYVLAPLGLIVNELPAQIVPLFTVSVGVVFTVTVIGVLADAVQFVLYVMVIIPSFAL